MKRLILFAIMAILASSAGCNFCKTFCPQQQPQPVYQPVYTTSSCTPVDACSPCSTSPMMAPAIRQ
jgi:hypothetical protein